MTNTGRVMGSVLDIALTSVLILALYLREMLQDLNV